MTRCIMKPARRVVTSLPLSELWNDRGPVSGKRERYLNHAELREVLRSDAVCFAVADVGHNLRWLSAQACFDFWKTEVSCRVAEPNMSIDLDRYPGRYCYFASAWATIDDGSIILLERIH